MLQRNCMQRLVIFTIAVSMLAACSGKKASLPESASVLHQNQDALTQVIIYDVFTPPVASRIYAYTSLASYEAIRFATPGYASLAEQMNGFQKMPVPDSNKQYDFALAATQAFFTVARKVTFSTDSLAAYQEPLMDQYRKVLDKEVYLNSTVFGDSIANAILARAVHDNYLQTRGKPKFIGHQEAGHWKPTPPDYADAVEYCWNTMHPFVIDSAEQFNAPPPPAYSTDTNSVFFKMVKEVYTINKQLTKEQEEIARFWDDNPFVTQHAGHLAFANKKITPGGHWMGIAAIALKKTNADKIKVARTYALTAITLFDAFISCWDNKYKWDYVRPVTVINQYIDSVWSPVLQTPPFPEYTSGHSTISAAAATVLTHVFGDNFSFTDTSDLRYIGMQRNFSSFLQASGECSISRLYGGIHYRFTVDTSTALGNRVGVYLIRKLRL
jgi:PAP2 superfamily